MSATPLLSILIPTLAWRQDKFLRLVDGLAPQCYQVPAPVEILGLQNIAQESLAAYRQRLLDNARGEYVCFIDDDDTVPGDYVVSLFAALRDMWADVVQFKQACTGTGAPLTVFGLKYEGYPLYPIIEPPHGLAYVRPFSHVCPVRAEIARKAGFMGAGHVWTGEDSAYVREVVPQLKEREREVFLDQVLYTYRYDGTDSTQHLSVANGTAARYAKHRRPLVASTHFRWVS